MSRSTDNGAVEQHVEFSVVESLALSSDLSPTDVWAAMKPLAVYAAWFAARFGDEQACDKRQRFAHLQ